MTKIVIPDDITIFHSEAKRLREERNAALQEIDHLREWVEHLSEEAQELDRLREAYRLPRLTDEQCQDLRIAFVDHDDNRDEALAAVIEWYLRARALNAGGKA